MSVSRKLSSSAIDGLNISKATGEDRVEAHFVVQLCRHFEQFRENFLLPLMNIIFGSGHVPSSWKSDRRIPLEKDGDSTDVSNYRTIAIHSVFRKILCTMIERRERAIVSFESTQYGFMPRKRTSDLAALLGDIIATHHKKRQDCYVAVIDFQKAFDRCHIPTLLRRKAVSGITGDLLALTASLYTDATARFMINGKLGEPFPITRGVAQGCVMSPIAFNIYIDELLYFLARAPGVTLALRDDRSADHASSSFVDDLVLMSDTPQQLQDLLDIVDDWCAESYFSVGLKKSGILHIGKRDIYPAFFIHGKEIRIINPKEKPEDEEEKELHENEQRRQRKLQRKRKRRKKKKPFVKYLGFLVTPDGSWNDFLDQQLCDTNRALGQLHSFLTSPYIRFQTKIQVAKTSIVSRVGYGADVVPADGVHERKLDAIWGKTLRKIFWQPKYSKTDSLRLIAGQVAVTNWRKSLAYLNSARFQNQTDSKVAEFMRDSPDLQRYGNTVKAFRAGEQLITRALKCTADATCFLEARDKFEASGSIIPLKKAVQHIVRDYDSVMTTRTFSRDPSTDQTFLQCFGASIHPPLLALSGPRYCTYVSWLIGSTGTYQDNPEFLQIGSPACRLCGEDTESRAHLLTSCRFTADYLRNFADTLIHISPQKHQEYTSVPYHERWLWILAAGCPPLPRRPPALRLAPLRLPFTRGKTYNVPNRLTLNEAIASIWSYQEILDSTPTRAYHIFTDGSFSVATSGAAAIIYHRSQIAAEISAHTGDCTNNYAELFAIVIALQWIASNIRSLDQEPVFAFFTDSTYVQSSLTSHKRSAQHFFTLQEISHLTGILEYEYNASFVIHKIPSHLETKTMHYCSIPGSIAVDRLANKARAEPVPFSSLESIRKRILDESARLLTRVSSLLRKADRDDGPSEDRLSVQAIAEQSSQEHCDTSQPVA